jgi:protein-L-isoaspartate O-methyltransferase
MGRTKRHLFCFIAYADGPISIGHGQTMSHRGLDDLDA